MSRLPFLSRSTFTGLTAPVARLLLRAGIGADVVTVIGTVGTVTAALILFPTGRLFAATLVVTVFVVFDMFDGAVARASGGSRFGAVLDATCDRISDGAILAGLAWWGAFGLRSAPLTAAALIALVGAAVTSYIKARAEASGLCGGGGYLERPERLIIVLTGAGVSDLPVVALPWALHAAMWVLAVGSVITCGQRLRTVRASPTAGDSPYPAEREHPQS